MEERTNRVLLATAGALLAAHMLRAPAASVTADEAANVPTALRARKLELVDERGRVRASLEVEASGEAVFRLRDPGGNIRVKLGASESGSGLLLLDDRTEPAVHARSRARAQRR